MATKEELIQRWEKFLSQIENRFNESLQQAEEASLDLLEESDYDYYQTIQAYTGMNGQIQNLISKIDQTWSEKVQPQMEDAFEDYDWIDQRQKGDQLSTNLWVELRNYETMIEGKLSKKYYEYAIKIADKEFSCSQCNAKLQINKRIFRSQYVTCDYCDTVNTFEPETKYTQIGWSIVDNIVKIDLLEKEKELLKTYQNLKECKDEMTEKDWDVYKKEYVAYHELFFKERIKLNIDYEKRFNEDMERKLKEFEKFKQL